MTELVALNDEQGNVVWINPAWVKIVRAHEAGSTLVEFMDGDSLKLDWTAQSVVRRLNSGRGTHTGVSPVIEKEIQDKSPSSDGAVKSTLATIARRVGQSKR